MRMTVGTCGGLRCTSHAYRVVWGAHGGCVMGLVWSHSSHSNTVHSCIHSVALLLLYHFLELVKG